MAAEPAITEDATASPAGRASLTVLLLASTLGVMGGATIAPLIEVIRQALGVGGTAAGLLLTCHSLAIALISPLVGRATDHLGPRLPLAFGLVLYGLGGGAGLVIDSYPVLIASRLVLGIGAAAVFTCSTAALLDLYQGGTRDKVMGWRTAATTAGGFIYPLAAGALGNHSWHTPFALYLLGVPLGVATLLALPKPAPTNGTNPVAKATRARGGAARLLRDHPLLLGLCGLWVASTGLMMVLAVSLPRRLDQLGIHDTLIVALYGTVLTAGAASLIGLAYAKLTARFGYTTLIRVAATSWTAALILFALADHWAPLLLVPVLTGIGSGITMPTLTVLADHAAPPEQRGTATSLQATALFGGQFASPLLFGPLIDATSIATGALVAAVGTTGILIALLRLKEPARSTDSATTASDDRHQAAIPTTQAPRE
ncbi:MFS transporter [Streptomyces sp. 8K308]|uniref:MFS transporter n=1 Tax=Streptomyces sp. 8K308 TaxID=2530388 RepID=UPI001046941C|nr:MFS transporter [Streptomyces sp. 8K308]TDC09544.1 MFS transporter [Streptomyces sp. 8K308]